MPITDATTSLATTWTEFSIVSFKAGTLTSNTQMQAEVQNKLQRGTLSATSKPTLTQVQGWLTRGKEELLQVKSFSFSRRYAYAPCVAGQYRYSLPFDFAGGSTKLRDTTTGRNLTYISSDAYSNRFPDMSAEDNDTPSIYTIKNMELWIGPPSSGTFQLELEYDRSGDDNTATDFLFLPELERFRVCDFALAEACEYLQDWKRMQMYRDKWSQGLVSSRRADARKKWKDRGYRARSIWEVQRDRFSQS